MTAMDTVLEYLDTVSDRADLPDLSDDQLLKDVDIVADWVNDILDLQVLCLKHKQCDNRGDS